MRSFGSVCGYGRPLHRGTFMRFEYFGAYVN